MLRWLKRKCNRYSTPSDGKRLSRQPGVEEPTETNYHIYEEIPNNIISPLEVAYAVVTLDKNSDDVPMVFDIDCPVCIYRWLHMETPCVCQDGKMSLSNDSDFPIMHHSSAVMTIDKSLHSFPFRLRPGRPKGESFSYEDSSSGYDSNSSSSLDIGIDDDLIKRLDNMHR